MKYRSHRLFFKLPLTLNSSENNAGLNDYSQTQTTVKFTLPMRANRDSGGQGDGEKVSVTGKPASLVTSALEKLPVAGGNEEAWEHKILGNHWRQWRRYSQGQGRLQGHISKRKVSIYRFTGFYGGLHVRSKYKMSQNPVYTCLFSLPRQRSHDTLASGSFGSKTAVLRHH